MHLLSALFSLLALTSRRRRLEGSPVHRIHAVANKQRKAKHNKANQRGQLALCTRPTSSPSTIHPHHGGHTALPPLHCLRCICMATADISLPHWHPLTVSSVLSSSTSLARRRRSPLPAGLHTTPTKTRLRPATLMLPSPACPPSRTPMTSFRPSPRPRPRPRPMTSHSPLQLRRESA